MGLIGFDRISKGLAACRVATIKAKLKLNANKKELAPAYAYAA